ncbi:hypothetical protein [Sphingobium aquiterrae]|uniref:hypothetical protein n=1 Tax=Sphingobium aquiterrae TaxID=2038656 RepID=UPI00301A134C
MPASIQHRETGSAEASRRTASIIAAGVLSAVVALCIVALHREDQVAQAKQLLDRQLSWGDSRAFHQFQLLPGDPPPRAQLTHALYLARGVAPLPDSKDKQRILDIAQREVDEAIASRPHWGEAWVVRAFIAYGRDNAPSPAMLADLAHSYGDGPLQRDAGPWRVRMALANWQAFDPATQDRIVAETVWLLQVSPPASRRVLFDLARSSPAYQRIFLRWRLFQLHERGLAG